MNKTLDNLKRSAIFAIKSSRGKAYQLKVMHAAFTRANGIMLHRKPTKKINKKVTSNQKHMFVLRLLALGLKPVEIVNLRVKDCKNGFVCSRGVWRELPSEFEEYLSGKQATDYLLYSNLGKKYNVRTVQEIRKKMRLSS